MNTKFIAILAFCLFSLATNAQDYWFLSATHIEASPGSQVCLDINAHPSSPIFSFQFTMAWEDTILAYDNAQNVGLPSTPVFGDGFIDEGKLLVSWFGFEPYTLTERTTIFSVCFDVVGELNDTSALAFTSDFTPIEVADGNFQVIPLEFINGEVVISAIPTGGEKLQNEAIIINPSCQNNEYGEISLFVEGGVTPLNIDWTGPDGYTGTGNIITNLAAGEYIVNVMDNIGFSLVDTFIVQDLTPGVSDVTLTSVSCIGSQNGSINITVEGGTEPYAYQWSNNTSFQDLSGLSAGEYFLTITDSLGCVYTDSYTIEDAVPITLDIASLTCPGQDTANGGGQFTASGGEGNFEFFWSNGDQNSTGLLSNASAGSYTVSVTDGNNCPFLTEDFVLEVGIESLADSYTICDGQEVEIQLSAPNANSILWSPADLLSCTDCATPIANTTVDTVLEVMISNPSGCTQIGTVELLVSEECVFPGDANNDGEANNLDVLWVGMASNSMGPARPNPSTLWKGFGMDDWGQSTPLSMVDYKYIDCNGDGTINSEDVDVIMQNYGETHGAPGGGPEGAGAGAPLMVEMPAEVADVIVHEFDLILGDADNAIAGGFGLVFSLNYDESLVEISDIDLTLDGWFGTAANSIYEINRKTPGNIDIGWVRSDGQIMSGQGKIGTLNIAFKAVTTDTPFSINIQDATLINDSEGVIEVMAMESNTIIKEDVIDAVAEPYVHSDKMFPNPTNGKLNIDTKRMLSEIKIFSATGKLLALITNPGTQIDLSKYAEGVYFLKLSGTDGISTHRVILEK